MHKTKNNVHEEEEKEEEEGEENRIKEDLRAESLVVTWELKYQRPMKSQGLHFDLAKKGIKQQPKGGGGGTNDMFAIPTLHSRETRLFL